MSEYNIRKLYREFVDAGIPIDGVHGDGKIDYKDTATTEQRIAGALIVQNHNPVWYVEQRLAAYPSIGEQLDMQYWDNVNGTTEWADLIASIKATYPKE